MDAVNLIGLKTCDTCRKARTALETAGATVIFRDVRADPPRRDELEDWLHGFGEALVNRRSTTWRGLAPAEREASPLDLLLTHPTLMKRPLLIRGTRRHLGWDREAMAALGLG
ncbi:MAG: arsenate reductase [Rhodobacteraceae bacterium]|nr:arsenate reductase [Paracoccaceae bacterium]